MLSPSEGKFLLLPQDREIMAALDLTEDEYRELCRLFAANASLPKGPQNFLLIPFLINVVVGIALTALSTLLARPQRPKDPAQTEQKTVDGQNIVSGTRYAPRAGFDSIQNVVEMGSIVPMIYANRQTINSVTYGGVRVNTNLLWSQIYSLGGSQMLRAVYLIGQAPLGAIDVYQLAFGNNLISFDELNPTNNQGGRISVYVSLDGGRINSADHVAGRQAAFDDGNAQTAGGPDVFATRGAGNAWTQDTCYVIKPTSQTQFGLFAPIGNGLSLRQNPVFRPVSFVNLTAPNSSGNSQVVCRDDTQLKAARNKQSATISARSQILGTDGALITAAVGATITLTLDSGSDAGYKFLVSNSDGPQGEVEVLDLAQTISARCRDYDSKLVVGDRYRIGSCTAVCVTRTAAPYVNDVDNEPIVGGSGTNVVATFRVTEAGQYRTTANNGSPSITNTCRTGTSTSHILKTAVASFTIERPCRVFEIGFKSSSGIRINGLCNFREAKSYVVMDDLSCDRYDGDTVNSGDTLQTQAYISGTYTGDEERYSFHRIGYKVAGSTGGYSFFAALFGFRGIGGQVVYNYLRVDMGTTQPLDITIVPVSGWEVRFGYHAGPLEVMDYRSPEKSLTLGSIVLRYRGRTMARSFDSFQLRQGQPPSVAGSDELGIPWADEPNYIDAWGKLAEQFIYEEVVATTSSPEHEISYINVITTNATVPDYSGLACIGINMRASTEFQSADQLSVPVTQGLTSTSRFSLVFWDMLTNASYGLAGVINPLQIDYPSFLAAANWTASRNYWFDIGISDPLNIRTQGQEWAGYFLLDMFTQNGKMYLQPMVDFAGPAPITTQLFTSGNILATSASDESETESTFGFAFADLGSRIPPIVIVSWRQERASATGTDRPLFPVVRQVTVRENATPDNAPLVRIDLTAFATSEVHAVDVGKMTCRLARLVTHSVSFKTTPEEAIVSLGKTFLVAQEVAQYNLPPNGIIEADGTIRSWPPLANGTYSIYAWRGKTNTIETISITVLNGKTTPLASTAVFALVNPAAPPVPYKTKSITFDEDGNIDIEGDYWPEAEIIANWDTGFVVEGRVT